MDSNCGGSSHAKHEDRGARVFATLAVGASYAATASASEPTYKICYAASPKGTGHYTGKTCSASTRVESGGNYELGGLDHAKKVTFTGKGKATEFELSREGFTAALIKCKSTSVVGHYGEEGGIWYAFSKITYGSCSSENGADTCSSKAVPGGILTNELKSRLVYIKRSPLVVGYLVEPAASGGAVAEFECSGFEDLWIGSWLMSVGPANVISGSPTESSTIVGTMGKMEYETYEGSSEAPNVPIWLLDKLPPPYALAIQSAIKLKGEKLEIEG